MGLGSKGMGWRSIFDLIFSSQRCERFFCFFEFWEVVFPSLKLLHFFAPENGWLEYYFPIFRGELLVSGRVVQNLKQCSKNPDYFDG